MGYVVPGPRHLGPSTARIILVVCPGLARPRRRSQAMTCQHVDLVNGPYTVFSVLGRAGPELPAQILIPTNNYTIIL